MITVDDTLERLLKIINILEPEEKPILNCLGQVLAEDIQSRINVPPYNNSAMDGYAVRHVDVEHASRETPVFLDIVGQVAAGEWPDKKVSRGTAIRIMTGAPIPDGADAVVKFEDTIESGTESQRRNDSEIGIFKAAEEGQNIRMKGEDVAAGQAVIPRGAVLRPVEIGLLASIGRSKATVVRRPVVAVLSTGNELRRPGGILSAGKIFNSNEYHIAANVIACGGIPRRIGSSLDSVPSLRLKIERGLNADLLVTSGGISVGDYDMVKDVLAEMGKIDFCSVRLKPGKPMALGILRGQVNGHEREIPFLGLPGNPTSCMVTFELFVRPAIMKMMGKTGYRRPVIHAALNKDIQNKDHRRVFIRVSITRTPGGYIAVPSGPQGSGILTTMMKANGLAVIPEDRSTLKSGDTVEVQMFDGYEFLLQGEP